MNNVTKIERLHIRIDGDLKDRFTKICDEKSINGSALIRKWVEEFVEEHERPLASLDILDIVWRLNKDKDESINNVCTNAAERLGYDEQPQELFEDLATLLEERATQTGTLKLVHDDHKYGTAQVNDETIYFALIKGRGLWSTEPKPAWYEPSI